MDGRTRCRFPNASKDPQLHRLGNGISILSPSLVVSHDGPVGAIDIALAAPFGPRLSWLAYRRARQHAVALDIRPLIGRANFDSRGLRVCELAGGRPSNLCR